ncbi:MAG TPA: hypothetical protein VMJ10_13970 [Kofleriaceae bacterium]|nr:hypothetical protein [Kofleriaceae bacterium]
MLKVIEMALGEQLALLRAQIDAYRSRAREVDAKLRTLSPGPEVRDMRSRLRESTVHLDRAVFGLARARVRARGTNSR